MKIIFAGTPEFAIPTLIALLNSHHKICCIYTQPDRPAGRGQKITQSPIKKIAITNNIPVYQPQTLKDQSAQKQLQEINADILINVAYGMILPEIVLNMFKFRCVNIHPSLLPRWRGAAPIQRAIMAADKTTGVTIMQMDTGLDTGNIYKQKTITIESTDTSATLLIKTAELGAKLLLDVLVELETGKALITTQDDTKSTYAKKISKEEGNIDWHKTAKEIDHMIRAFNPWPIAYTKINSQLIRIWQAEVINNSENENTNVIPGIIKKINKNGIDVITGNGVLRLKKIQFPGGKQLFVKDILNSNNQLFVIGGKFVL